MNGFENVHVANASTEDLTRLDQWLLERGTTSWLGTIVTAPLEKMSASLVSLHESFQLGHVQGFAGIHVEGPFLGAAPGAHPVKHIIACDSDWLSRLVPSVRLVTVAPEQIDVIPAVRLSRERNISAGSCTPLVECVQRVVRECGVSLESALASATSIPADLVGLSEIGRIRRDQMADLLALDTDLSVLKAWRRLPS